MSGAAQIARRRVEAAAILAKLTRLRVLTWRYNHEPETVRHIGPIAEEFAAAFGVGSSNRVIALDDALGVAYASIQALDAEIGARRRELAALQKRVAALERRRKAGKRA